MRREFEIILYPDGTVRIERRSDSDDVCVQEVIPVREVLGDVLERKLKGSFGHAHGHVHTHEHGDEGHRH